MGSLCAAIPGAVSAYVALARAHGLDPAQMALAFAASRPFMASVILGATAGHPGRVCQCCGGCFASC